MKLSRAKFSVLSLAGSFNHGGDIFPLKLISTSSKESECSPSSSHYHAAIRGRGIQQPPAGDWPILLLLLSSALRLSSIYRLEGSKQASRLSHFPGNYISRKSGKLIKVQFPGDYGKYVLLHKKLKKTYYPKMPNFIKVYILKFI
jgi:hypothetical protein